jgi:indoleamine 2,3-dioxygenase
MDRHRIATVAELHQKSIANLTYNVTEMLSQLESYDVDGERGFLPRPDPLDCLPKGFDAWEEVGRELPKLMLTGKLRSSIKQLPLLDAARLGNDREIKRAMVILSYLGHAYVWGEKEPTDSIPPSLAVPWHQTGRMLGRPPVLSYASYALDNWRRVDIESPIEVGNIVLLQNFLGGQDEEWFVLIHVAIEAAAGSGLAAIVAAQRAVANEAPERVADHLAIIARSVEAMNRILLRMPERCAPYIYFHRVRPYIHGWANQPSLPSGIVYEGVEEYAGKPQKFRGETGAQSSIIPALDAALGITHAEDMLRNYLNEMRDYRPPKHRRFIEAVEAGPSVRDFVLRHSQAHPTLRDLYNSAIDGIGNFRSTHLEYAHRYINKQTRGDARNPNSIGTGGTPFMPYLTKHRNETKSHKIAPRKLKRF